MPQGLSLADFDAVLFDVDGTLVDSLGMIIPGLADGIEKYAGFRPSDEEVQSIIGTPMRQQLRRYLSYDPTEEQYAEMADFTLCRFQAYESMERNFDPAIDLLRLCKRTGIKTSLVTSKDAKELAMFLKRFIGAAVVNDAVCSSDVQHPKPAPDSALLAVERLGVAPERALFIGDSIYDLQCAKAAGIKAVAVGYGSSTREALLAEGPDAFFETPDDLLAWAERSMTEPTCPERNKHQQI